MLISPVHLLCDVRRPRSGGDAVVGGFPDGLLGKLAERVVSLAQYVLLLVDPLLGAL